MGRGSGMDQVPIGNSGRRRDRAATALGVAPNPKRQASPDSQILIPIPGDTDSEGRNRLYLNASSLLECRVPETTTPSGQAIYPAPVPTDRLKFISGLWEIWRRGDRPDAPALSAKLWKDGEGIGTKDLGSRGKSREISRETLREEMSELIHRLRLPIIGFHLASSRDEVQAEVDELRGRVQKMNAAGKQLGRAHATREWWNGGSPSSVRLAGYSTDVVQTALEAMASRPYKARELAAHLAQVDERRWSDVKVRDLIHELRIASVPVISHTHRGSAIAESPDELETYLHRLKDRIEAVKDRASCLEEAGAIWFPQNDEEKAISRAWQRKTHEMPRSERALQRDRKRAEARSRHNETRDEEKQLEREGAQSRVDTAMKDLVFRSLLACDPKSLSAEEKRRIENFKEDQQFLKTGRKPRAKGKLRSRDNDLVSSRSAASMSDKATVVSASTSTPPWER